MNEIKQTSKKLQIAIIILLIIALGGLITSGVLLKKVRALQNPNATAEQQVKDTVAEVSKVIILPANETPSLATVADPTKLQDQPFFTHAEAGDVVLIYSTSKKAILWRPSTKQVVEVSPLNISASSTPK
jgi:L-fucose isomerase-like protein